MPNWENGCIYMLRHKDDVELQNIYIGSTTNFRGRKYEHKSCCNNQNYRNYYHQKYNYIRANGGWDNWKMIWLEDYPCKSKKELLKREDEVMLQYENRLNQVRACITDEERKEYKEKHRLTNKEKIAERDKTYYKNNRDKILENVKQWNQNNIEKQKEYKKNYYENNKDKYMEKIKCDICGCEISRQSLKRHQRTIKCQNHNKMST